MVTGRASPTGSRTNLARCLAGASIRRSRWPVDDCRAGACPAAVQGVTDGEDRPTARSPPRHDTTTNAWLNESRPVSAMGEDSRRVWTSSGACAPDWAASTRGAEQRRDLLDIGDGGGRRRAQTQSDPPVNCGPAREDHSETGHAAPRCGPMRTNACFNCPLDGNCQLGFRGVMAAYGLLDPLAASMSRRFGLDLHVRLEPTNPFPHVLHGGATAQARSPLVCTSLGPRLRRRSGAPARPTARRTRSATVGVGRPCP